MSALTLTLRETLPGRLDLSPLLPALLSQALADLPKLVLRIDTQDVCLGDLFTLAGDDAQDLVLVGDLSRVDRIGAGLAGGTLRVDGHAGAYLGQGMTGSSLTVTGDVAAFAAAALRRGTITIGGNAGDYLGGALPGAMQGMAGGQVVVYGNAGARCGDRMRRGAILVAGSLGAYAGSRMLAGTVLALQGAGAHAGYGMRRGSLMVRGAVAVDATFADCGTHALPIVRLLFRSWRVLGGEFAGLADQVRPVRRLVGDRAADGKGEILRFS